MEENKYVDTKKEEINGDINNVDTEQNIEEPVDKSPSEEEQLNEITAKLAESQDRYLRLAAEFDNYRKRTLKERMELVKTAGEDILKDLLPVIDDFDRAIEMISSSDSIEAILEGVKLIYNKFNSTLEQKGLVAIAPAGEDFNADVHEAIAKIPAGDAEKAGKIIDVVQKGYSLNDKIIRHPKVVIGE
ncbi:MAG: nucleotide exchange factor GrpE [Prevotellaceae bacterium]|jgi:molecular chaperone GrpE|nr:nucleotide exchange factor GrpE [Prevotellaceae bacterium]